ncbi:hypothetical protein BGW39_009335 [Mortierella sp. 14UC]|nr:hypothetical protein BGW39_009335 [Mortierella sp. 14UC]
MWVLRMFLWLAFLVAVQIVVMGLLFRPISNNNLEKGPPQRAGTFAYKERDYQPGQLGFITFLEDGFGTETLAFCHDLLELSNDQHRQLRVARSLQDRVLSSLIQAYDAALETSSSISSGAGRWLNSKWASLWEEAERDDPLDWLAN